MWRGRLRVGSCVVLGVIGLALAGCSEPTSTFEFDTLDLIPVQEEMTEFPLGEYKIPIPVVQDRGEKLATRLNRFQLDFALYALVPAEEQSMIAAAWARHEGAIRDRVICVCRHASVDELLEPELATLKARLVDALATQTGEKEFRQLLIAEVVSHPL